MFPTLWGNVYCSDVIIKELTSFTFVEALPSCLVQRGMVVTNSNIVQLLVQGLKTVIRGIVNDDRFAFSRSETAEMGGIHHTKSDLSAVTKNDIYH